jgi:FkbM family methyltransferase
VKTKTLLGPTGHYFLIPAEPPETSRICEVLTQAVWAGEYDCPELPTEGIRSVLDIGAGWGAFAVWAMARWGEDTLIIGYEPHEEAAEFFKMNAPNAFLHPLAVTTDPAPILSIREDWGSCSVYETNEGRPVKSIHPARLPKVDVLKIDAEGVEPEILEHYPYLSSLKELIYEFHHIEHRDRIRPMCEAAGLRQVREDRDGTYGTAIWVPR